MSLKNRLILTLIPGFLILSAFMLRSSMDHEPLPIGSSAPDFKLKGVDGNYYSLASFSSAKILVVIFTCNHCATAQSYEDRIIRLVEDYKSRGVAFVAIMPNDPASLRLDELDFSDLGDTYEDMKTRAAKRNSIFPIYMTERSKPHQMLTVLKLLLTFLFLTSIAS